MSVDTAVILAAGLGSRIPEFSLNAPKGFISIGGRPIIERSLDILVHHGLRRIIIGTGYRAMDFTALTKRHPGVHIECVFNGDYANSGSLETLLLCTEGLDCDFVSLESDLLYDSRMIGCVLSAPYANVILASGETRSGDEVYIETNERSELLRLSKDSGKLSRIDAELVGICKLAAEIPSALRQWLAQAGLGRPAQLHYEEGLVGIADSVSLHVEKVDLPWTEIDTMEHFERANKLIWPRIESVE